MIHPILPQSKTSNELGAWIAENAITGEKKRHEERVPFTKEEIAAFEHDSAVACREMDRLQAILDSTKKRLNEGLLSETTITIPVTTGLKILDANRKFACDQIERGYRTDFTELYAFPWPEKNMITYVDIEGNHWAKYDHVMNPIQEKQYAKPLLNEAAAKFHDGLAKSGMKVTGVTKDAKGNPTINIEVKDTIFSAEDQQKPLFDSE